MHDAITAARKTIEAGGGMNVMTETVRLQPHPPYELTAAQVRELQQANEIATAIPIPSAADYEARLRSILGSREDPDTIETYLRRSFEADGDETNSFWSRVRRLCLSLF